MSDHGDARAPLSEQALDILFRAARSFDVYKHEPVSDETLRTIYEVVKWGPTNSNSQPQRIVFLLSDAAKQRLLPALSSKNRTKSLSAPVVAILAYDLRFFEHLPRM